MRASSRNSVLGNAVDGAQVVVENLHTVEEWGMGQHPPFVVPTETHHIRRLMFEAQEPECPSRGPRTDGLVVDGLGSVTHDRQIMAREDRVEQRHIVLGVVREQVEMGKGTLEINDKCTDVGLRRLDASPFAHSDIVIEGGLVAAPEDPGRRRRNGVATITGNVQLSDNAPACPSALI